MGCEVTADGRWRDGRHPRPCLDLNYSTKTTYVWDQNYPQQLGCSATEQFPSFTLTILHT